MNRRSFFVAATAFAAMLGASAGVHAADPMKVSASFSVLGDMVKEVGGDRVEVFTFVGPNGDAHVYEPTPADAKELSESKILFINGLGLEGWMTRLEKSSGFKGTVVTASKGVAPRKMVEIEGITTVSLVDLIEIKLRSGSSNILRAQDLADAVQAAGDRSEAHQRFPISSAAW